MARHCLPIGSERDVIWEPPINIPRFVLIPLKGRCSRAYLSRRAIGAMRTLLRAVVTQGFNGLECSNLLDSSFAYVDSRRHRLGLVESRPTWLLVAVFRDG